MTHHVFRVDAADKATIVKELASGHGRSVLFTRTKHQAKKLAKQLTAAGVPAVDLHGNLSQNARERNLEAFTSGTTRVLCATDIAARGIHVDDVAIVVHVDPPAEHKAYLHRSGRTARAGAEGAVVTIATPDQAGEVRTLARQAGITPEVSAIKPGAREITALIGPAAPYVEPAPRRGAAAPGQRRRTSSRRRRFRPRLVRRRGLLGWAQQLGQRRQVRWLGPRVRPGAHPRRARRPRRLVVGRVVQQPVAARQPLISRLSTCRRLSSVETTTSRQSASSRSRRRRRRTPRAGRTPVAARTPAPRAHPPAGPCRRPPTPPRSARRSRWC